MKRPVSLVAFLVIACVPPAMLAGCSGAKAGKAEFAEACQAHMGGQKTKCECYVASVEQTLTPELFASVAQGAYDNRKMNGMV